MLTGDRRFVCPGVGPVQRSEWVLGHVGELIDDILRAGARRRSFRVASYHNARRMLIALYTALLTDFGNDANDELIEDTLILVERGLRRRLTLRNRAERVRPAPGAGPQSGPEPGERPAAPRRLMADSPAPLRVGSIGVIGRPSTGKSSLINRICGHKVSIVSPVPQTTRSRVRGIVTREQGQLIFLDTPGLHLSDRKLNPGAARGGAVGGRRNGRPAGGVRRRAPLRRRGPRRAGCRKRLFGAARGGAQQGGSGCLRCRRWCWR